MIADRPQSTRIVPAAILIGTIVFAVGTPIIGWFAFRWWQDAHTTHWFVQVTNERDSELLVAGVSGPMSEGTGYTVLGARASVRAEVGDQDAPPDAVIFDFASHKGSRGELVVVPVWQQYRRDIVCSWDDVQKYQPLVVTEAASSCADLAGR